MQPLTYSIDNGSSFRSTNRFLLETGASYDIVVKDARGCEVVWLGSSDVSAPHVLDTSFHVYPNPAHERWYVERSSTSAPIEMIEVYSLDGRRVIQLVSPLRTVLAERVTYAVDAHTLESGTYVLVATSRDGAQASKVYLVK